MPVTSLRVLLYGRSAEGSAVTITDQATSSVLATAQANAAGTIAALQAIISQIQAGDGSFLATLPYAEFLQGVAAGQGSAVGTPVPGAQSGGAGGTAGGSGTLSQAQHLAGGAAGAASGSAAETTGLTGAAAGAASGTATPAVTTPGSNAGSAGGAGGGSGTLTQAVPLGGSAGGSGGAGPSTESQDGPHMVAAGGGQAAGTATVTQGKALVGSAAGAATGSGTVTSSGGGGTSVSDNFNRANNSSLGAGWAAQSGIAGRFSITSNVAAVSAVGADSADRRTETFADRQYAEANLLVSNFYPHGCGVYARGSASAATLYAAMAFDNDDFGDQSSVTPYVKLFKVVGGTWTEIGSWQRAAFGAGQWSTVGPLVVRLEADGTALAVKTATTHGGTYTTRISVTDSAIASGSPGVVGQGGSLDDFYAGDLP